MLSIQKCGHIRTFSIKVNSLHINSGPGNALKTMEASIGTLRAKSIYCFTPGHVASWYQVW